MAFSSIIFFSQKTNAFGGEEKIYLLEISLETLNNDNHSIPNMSSTSELKAHMYLRSFPEKKVYKCIYTHLYLYHYLYK